MFVFSIAEEFNGYKEAEAEVDPEADADADAGEGDIGGFQFVESFLGTSGFFELTVFVMVLLVFRAIFRCPKSDSESYRLLICKVLP